MINKLFIIGFIILFCIVIYYWIFKKEVTKENFTDEQIEEPKIKNSQTPIITMYKGGGFAGINHKIEIYDNGSYNFFDKDQIVGTGKLDSDTYISMNILLQIFPELQDREPQGAFDTIHYKLQVDDEIVDFHDNVPSNVWKHLSKLDELMS